MLLEINGKKYNFIGDPHFGKKFGDVPLHRKGEREQQQLDTFKVELAVPADMCIMVGDLFDTFTVSNEVLMNVHNILVDALNENKTQYVMLMGNHDVSRDAHKISSFQVLKSMFKDNEEIEFITTHKPYILDKILFCPYSEFKTAK